LVAWDIISRLFCEDIDAIFSHLYRGYYYLALNECDKRLNDHGRRLDSWECKFLEGLRTYLQSWNIDKAYVVCGRDLNPEGLSITASIEDIWKQFYQCLFRSWLCCQERMNYSLIQEAINAANQALHLIGEIDKIDRDEVIRLSEPFEDLDFFPKPWSIRWLRARARRVQGHVRDAGVDYIAAHRWITKLARTYTEISTSGHEARIKAIKKYGRDRDKIAARFYNDFAFFVYDEYGDLRTAKELLNMAVGTFTQSGMVSAGIDPSNAYIWSNLGFILYLLREEDQALNALIRGYRIILYSKKSDKTTSFISGRTYYFLGIFALRWLRREMDPVDDDMESKLATRIASLPSRERKIFEDIKTTKLLFEKSLDNYLGIHDIARALPAFLAWNDPLAKSNSLKGEILAARTLVWELCYGKPDFIDDQLHYERLIRSYLLAGTNIV